MGANKKIKCVNCNHFGPVHVNLSLCGFIHGKNTSKYFNSSSSKLISDILICQNSPKPARMKGKLRLKMGLAAFLMISVLRKPTKSFLYDFFPEIRLRLQHLAHFHVSTLKMNYFTHKSLLRRDKLDRRRNK